VERFSGRAAPASPDAGACDGVWTVRAALCSALVLVGLSLAEPAAVAVACSEPRLLRDGAAPPLVACAAGDRGLARVDGPTGLLFGRPLDLNRASARSLEVLPGIGPRRAAAIVHERERQRFQSVAALRRVPGIGPATVARLAGWVTCPDPAEAGANAARAR
jgi:competence ComEA-like helix-hairpin-helix protein